MDDQTAAPSALPSAPPAKPVQPVQPPVQTVAPADQAIAVDLDTLAVKADGGDGPSANTLQDLAATLGVSQDSINKAANWVEVAGLIKAKRGPVETGESEETEETEEVEEVESPFRPVVGTTYGLSLIHI